MTDDQRSRIGTLLRRARQDRESALRELLPEVHDDLRRIAGAQMRRERPDHTLEPTALVHEAFVRLVDERGLEWQDRAHFLAVAALAMRRILVELRFFGGLTFEEAAHVLEVSPKTVEADWYFARAWLRREMRAGSGPAAG
jgi:DNA-directed RNA polymerase specialized sigma24 family protein